MLFNMVVNYQVLQAAKMLGLLDELMEHINELESNIKSHEDASAYEGVYHISRLVFRIRASIGQRDNSIVMIIERVG